MEHKQIGEQDTQDTTNRPLGMKGIDWPQDQLEIRDLTEKGGIHIIQNIKSYCDDLLRYIELKIEGQNRNPLYFYPEQWTIQSRVAFSKLKISKEKWQTLEEFKDDFLLVEDGQDRPEVKIVKEASKNGFFVLETEFIFSIGFNREHIQCKKYGMCLKTNCEICKDTVQKD